MVPGVLALLLRERGELRAKLIAEGAVFVSDTDSETVTLSVTATHGALALSSGLIALYLNVFVLIVQSFQKVPALQKLAPTQSEPPFIIAQTIALLIFVVLGILAGIKFHPEATRPV